MRNKIVETCIVGKDGRLHLPADRVRQFASGLRGRRIIATFEAVPIEQTEAQRTYYNHYVVPCIRDAMWERGTRLTEEQVDEFLVGEYPGRGDVDRAKDFGKEAMTDFLDWLQEFAAENLDVYVEDPALISPPF